MANNGITSIHNFRVSLKNGSWSEYSPTSPTIEQESYYQTMVKYYKTFPMWTNNTIFNIIYAFGILANILLLVYLVKYKRYKKPVFCVILSMGAADMSLCLAGLLWYSFLSPFIVGPLWLCSVVLGMMQLSSLASSYHIAAFAVLRFFQLVYPLKSLAKVTTTLLSKVCLTIWAIHSIQGVAMTFYIEPVKIPLIESPDTYVCAIVSLDQRGLYILNLWMIIDWICVPFITTSGFHVAKHVTVVLSHSDTSRSEYKRGHQGRRQTDSRALAIVIVLYLVTMVPYIVQVSRLFLFGETLTGIDVFLLNLFSQISYSNSAINPFIYLFADESVRSDIRKMITCKRKISKSSTNVIA